MNSHPNDRKVILLRPRGFCAGVVRAVDVVSLALEIHGSPIYVRREIVHNRHVVADLTARGAVFVREVSEVPEGARVIFSAHGVSPEVRREAEQRRLRVIDATCPLVTKVHLEAVRFAKAGRSLLLVGHRDHEEVEGTMGEAPEATQVVSNAAEAEAVSVPDPGRVAYLTQTTLSLSEAEEVIAVLKRRFPAIQAPPSQDICYATENRQRAVRALSPLCGLVLVVGSRNSSNSNRLVEVAREAGTRAALIDDAGEIVPAWLEGVATVGLTAGASAPEVLVRGVLDRLAALGYARVEESDAVPEDVHFALPRGLEQGPATAGPSPVACA